MNQMQRRQSIQRDRSAYSLLELVLAVALVGGTLVPALALMRDSMTLSRTTDQRALLANYAIDKLEERTADVAMNWPGNGSNEGDLAADGHASVRYLVEWSDDPASGGIDQQLMHIEVTTYLDQDGDDALGAGEPRCYFRTKIGKFATYEAKALY